MVTLESNALTTLETVKADLGITVSTYDDRLRRLINAVSDHFENIAGRIFYRDTAIVEAVPGYGYTHLRVKRAPLNSVTSIVYDSSTTVDSGDYSILDAEAGIIEKVNGWSWTAHSVRDVSYGPLPGTERPLYAVTYDGGWYTPEQSKARGTITFTGLPGADETLVINLTTITAKASGATTDQFNIGTDARTTCDNLVAAINAGSESGNVQAWRVGLTVIVEWLEPGTDGNSVVFTETLSNATIDGSGTLGGTQAGVARGLPWDLEDAAVETVRATYKGKSRDPHVTSEKLLTWGASYGSLYVPDTAMAVVNGYRRLT
jgi:hypothetical protein